MFVIALEGKKKNLCSVIVSAYPLYGGQKNPVPEQQSKEKCFPWLTFNCEHKVLHYHGESVQGGIGAQAGFKSLASLL